MSVWTASAVDSRPGRARPLSEPGWLGRDRRPPRARGGLDQPAAGGRSWPATMAWSIADARWILGRDNLTGLRDLARRGGRPVGLPERPARHVALAGASSRRRNRGLPDHRGRRRGDARRTARPGRVVQRHGQIGDRGLPGSHVAPPDLDQPVRALLPAHRDPGLGHGPGRLVRHLRLPPGRDRRAAHGRSAGGQHEPYLHRPVLGPGPVQRRLPGPAPAGPRRRGAFQLAPSPDLARRRLQGATSGRRSGLRLTGSLRRAHPDQRREFSAAGVRFVQSRPCLPRASHVDRRLPAGRRAEPHHHRLRLRFFGDHRNVVQGRAGQGLHRPAARSGPNVEVASGRLRRVQVDRLDHGTADQTEFYHCRNSPHLRNLG